jgi:subtilisin family serine protease
MAAPHVAGAAALALAQNPSASPAAIATFLTTYATPNRLSALGTGSPNLLLYSLGAGATTEPLNATVAIKSLAGSSAKSGSGWRAYATASVRDIKTGALVANAKVSGSFLPGGAASCVTGTQGNCTMKSTVINKLTKTSVMTAQNISGTNMTYDASQNAATQISITWP